MVVVRVGVGVGLVAAVAAMEVVVVVVGRRPLFVVCSRPKGSAVDIIKSKICCCSCPFWSWLWLLLLLLLLLFGIKTRTTAVLLCCQILGRLHPHELARTFAVCRLAAVRRSLTDIPG